MDGKIITLTGHKYCGKCTVAMKLTSNSDVSFVMPYTDMHIPFGENAEKHGNFTYVSKEYLDNMIETDNLLCLTELDGVRYCLFESQMTSPFNVVVVDDKGVLQIKKNWKGSIHTVKVWSDKEDKSDRVGTDLTNNDFDDVFHFGVDDISDLEWRIGYDFD